MDTALSGSVFVSKVIKTKRHRGTKVAEERNDVKRGMRKAGKWVEGRRQLGRAFTLEPFTFYLNT